MTYRECYEMGRAVLDAGGVAEYELDARLMLEYVCGTDRNTLLVHGDREVTESEVACYKEFLEKRAKRVPLQHLTGIQEFMGLEFKVSRDVLIPRQDTEILVEEALKNLRDGMSILDMCTGSGCILISLMHYSNECRGVGVDISSKALEVADENASRLLERYKREEDALVFLQSNLFENVKGKYDIIVSNPPYIESGVIPELMPEVRDHEPVEALDGGESGLDFYRKIIGQSASYLSGDGMLFLEIGYAQGRTVEDLMVQAGFEEVQIVKDYAGHDRVVRGILRA